MFIRTKTRKNSSGKLYTYAYLVKNKYRKKGPKQSIKKYLGRVHVVEKTANKSFKEHLSADGIVSYFNKKPLKTAILELLKLELLNHGFIEQQSMIFKKDDLTVNLMSRTVVDGSGNNICMALNDGYLGSFTLSKTLDFKPPESIDKEIGKHLAKQLISAGIYLEKDVFLALFEIVKNSLKH